MLGDVSGGSQIIATELVDIAAVGAHWHSQSAKRIRQSAQKNVLKALNDDPAFVAVSHDRVLALLTRQPVAFTRSVLIEASEAAADLDHDLDAALARRVHDALPFDGDDPATKRLVYLVLEAGMRACHADKAFQDEVKKTQLIHLVKGQGEIRQDLTEIKNQLSAQQLANEKRLIEQLQDKTDQLHLTQQLVIALAKRSVQSVRDFDQALQEFNRMIDVASDEQIKSSLPANTDEAITAILAKVDELNNAGQIDEAATHLAEEETRVEAGLIRLYDKGIAQAVLTRDVDAACDYELKKIAIDVSEPATQFGALRRVQDVWYERGRDKGLNFDLDVAIALAHKGCSRASDADQRGEAQNNLGIALWALGSRESDPQRLNEAVDAYRAALEERTQDRVPLDWAETQKNLALVMMAFANHPATTEPRSFVESALEHVNASLEVFDADQTPRDHEKATRLREKILARLASDD